jgi:hypothetical protein
VLQAAATERQRTRQTRTTGSGSNELDRHELAVSGPAPNHRPDLEFPFLTGIVLGSHEPILLAFLNCIDRSPGIDRFAEESNQNGGVSHRLCRPGYRNNSIRISSSTPSMTTCRDSRPHSATPRRR